MKVWTVKLQWAVESRAEWQQNRLWAESEEVRSTGEEFKVSLFWKSSGRRSRGAKETAHRRTLDYMDLNSAMEKVKTSASVQIVAHRYFQMWRSVGQRVTYWCGTSHQCKVRRNSVMCLSELSWHLEVWNVSVSYECGCFTFKPQKNLTFLQHSFISVQDHEFLSERGFILFSYTENQVSSELYDVHLKVTYPAFLSFLWLYAVAVVYAHIKHKVSHNEVSVRVSNSCEQKPRLQTVSF